MLSWHLLLLRLFPLGGVSGPNSWFPECFVLGIIRGDACISLRTQSIHLLLGLPLGNVSFNTSLIWPITLIPSFDLFFLCLVCVGASCSILGVHVYGVAFFLETSFLSDARGSSFKRQSVGWPLTGVCVRGCNSHDSLVVGYLCPLLLHYTGNHFGRLCNW